MGIVQRGNTAHLAFTFFDENGDVAAVDNAEVQLTYAGRDQFETEKVTLTESGDEWIAEWNSAKARPGWVEYHAHAVAAQYHLVVDDRFRLTGNRAGLDHDALPNGQPSLADYA